MQKWEYISIRQVTGLFGGGVFYIFPNGEEIKYSGNDVEGKEVHTLLNFFGQRGYELVVTTTRQATNMTVFDRIWVMKRPKPEE